MCIKIYHGSEVGSQRFMWFTIPIPFTSEGGRTNSLVLFHVQQIILFAMSVMANKDV